MGALVKQWAGLNKLQTRYEQYREKFSALPLRLDRGEGRGEVSNPSTINSQLSTRNKAQHQLRETFDPFFAALHEGLKQLDKTVRQHEKQRAFGFSEVAKRLIQR